MSNNPFPNDDEEEPPTLFGVEEPASDRPDSGLNAPEAGFGAGGGGGFGDLGAIEDDLVAGGGLGGFGDLEDGVGFGLVGDGDPPATLGPPASGGVDAGLGFPPVGGDDGSGLGFGPVGGDAPPATLGPPADGADMAGGLGGFDDMGGGLGFGPIDEGEPPATLAPPADGDDRGGLFGMADGERDDAPLAAAASAGLSQLSTLVTGRREFREAEGPFGDQERRATPRRVADDAYETAQQLAEDDPEEGREFLDTVAGELEATEGADARETFEQRIDRLDTQRRRRETAASVGATVSGAVGSARETVSGAVGSVSGVLGRGSADEGDMSTGRDPRASSRPQSPDDDEDSDGRDPRASSRPQTDDAGDAEQEENKKDDGGYE